MGDRSLLAVTGFEGSGLCLVIVGAVICLNCIEAGELALVDALLPFVIGFQSALPFEKP